MSRELPVKGLRELDKFLSALPANMQRNAYAAGLRAAAKVIATQAQADAPTESGEMALSIKAGSVHKNQDGTLSIFVRAASAKQRGNGHAYLAYFHEFGVAPHLIARTGAREGPVAIRKAKAGKGNIKGGVMRIGDGFASGIIQHPGHAAHPFMRPALDLKAPEAVQAFAVKIRAYFEGKTGLAIPMDEAA